MVAPHIVKPLPTIVHGQIGEITTLEAKAYGKPMPTTKWLKDGQEIHESEHFLIDNYADGTSILTISNAEPETIDRITFEAVSPLGVAETVTELHVEGIVVIVVTYYKFYTIFKIFMLILKKKFYKILIFAIFTELIFLLCIRLPQIFCPFFLLFLSEFRLFLNSY